MPDDSIMDWVNNEEGLYNDLQALYAKWTKEGDAWSEVRARNEGRALAKHFAQAIEENIRGKYTEKDYVEAVNQMLEEFEEHRDYVIKKVVENAKKKPKPEDLVMDEGDKEHFRKYEERAQKLGIDHIRGYMPVSAQRVRRALEQGDKYLNTIPLRDWDKMAQMMGYRNEGWSMSEAVSLLKHVARWHFA